MKTMDKKNIDLKVVEKEYKRLLKEAEYLCEIGCSKTTRGRTVDALIETCEKVLGIKSKD